MAGDRSTDRGSRIAVIEDAAAAASSLDPIRSRLLAELSEPASATMLAARVGLARQKVNYHLRELELHGLVELVEGRRKGNVNDRMLRATAASYVISPRAMPVMQPDSGRSPDRVSGRWLLALATRMVCEVGELATAARAAFAQELSGAVTALVGKYHDDSAPGGRSHRVIVAVHPSTEITAGEV